MRVFLFSILSIVALSLVASFLTGAITGAVVEKEPCRLVRCYTDWYGAFVTPAENIANTTDGYAICHCKNEPDNLIYLIKL